MASQPYLSGNEIGMGDIPLGSFIYAWFEMPIERAPQPHLQAWYAAPEAASGVPESRHDRVDLILTIDTLDCTCVAAASTIALMRCGCIRSPPALIYPFLPFLVRKSDMSSALSIRQLTKTYGNGFQALSGIDLDVAEGDFFALLGPNGAGKSTTIGILSTLVNKTSGTVNIFGHDLDKNPAQLKRSIGVVPQEFNFNQFEKTFDIVVTQAGYYGIPAKIAKERAEQYLTQLGLWDKRDVPSRSLSGGMKRRLMIARALVHEPRLLILDEPTAGVDIELRRSMWTFLTELNQKGITIILTTHYLEEAEQLCRNIGIIDHGTIVENTSMKQLLGQLHVETFLLDLKNDLNVAPQLLGYPARLIDSHTLEVQVDKSMGITALFTQLAQQNIEVLSLRNKTNRLEELFVSLVEKNLSKVAV